MGMPQGKKKGLSTRNSTDITKVKRKGEVKNPYGICKYG